MTQELLTSHIYRGFFFVTRSASFRFWKLFSKIGNSLNKLNYLAVASFFHDPAWQKFGKKWRILEVFQKPETRVIRIHHCQQLIAILFWITYPRVRYPKKNDMTTFISQQTLDNCIFWPELTHGDVCYTHTHMERPSANNVARETQQITLCPRKYISKHCYLYPRETGKGSVGEADTAFHCRLLAPTQMSAGI